MISLKTHTQAWLLTRLSLLISFSLVALGCGHEEKPSSPDLTIFSMSNPNSTKWTTSLEVSQTDDKTQQPQAGSKKHIDVIYEFKPAKPSMKWRRLMRIADENGAVRSMFQEGEVTLLDAERMTLSVAASSCDDASGMRVSPSPEIVYFRSQPSLLQLDTVPIAPPAANLNEFFGRLMTKPIADMFRLSLEQVFTFGSARAFLTSGHGDFKLDTAFSTDIWALGEIGCFAIFGHDFAPSTLRPSW